MKSGCCSTWTQQSMCMGLSSAFRCNCSVGRWFARHSLYMLLLLLQEDVHQIDQIGDSSSKGGKKAKQDPNEPRFQLTDTQYMAPFMINSIGEHYTLGCASAPVTSLASSGSIPEVLLKFCVGQYPGCV